MFTPPRGLAAQRYAPRFPLPQKSALVPLSALPLDILFEQHVLLILAHWQIRLSCASFDLCLCAFARVVIRMLCQPRFSRRRPGPARKARREVNLAPFRMPAVFLELAETR